MLGNILSDSVRGPLRLGALGEGLVRRQKKQGSLSGGMQKKHVSLSERLQKRPFLLYIQNYHHIPVHNSSHTIFTNTYTVIQYIQYKLIPEVNRGQ